MKKTAEEKAKGLCFGDEGQGKCLYGMNPEVLCGELEGLGQPSYRGKQVFAWLHRRGAENFGDMTDLPEALRQELANRYILRSVRIAQSFPSKLDGTVKYLYTLWDGNQVEGVTMEHHHGTSLCISTQVGCAMGCTFCASGIGGKVRNLTAGEMLGEVYAVEKTRARPVDTLVLMGMGEPLDNFQEVTAFLGLLSHPEGRKMSLRHVSLSTCGLTDRIRQLAELRLPLTLSVSLHGPTDEVRSRLMPVNRRYPVDELLSACGDYFRQTGRRVSYEYILLQGVNDSARNAHILADKLKGTGSHVNLIPGNPVKELSWKRSSPERISAFMGILSTKGISVTVRREHGTDVNGACGQLRRAYQAENKGDGVDG